MNVGQRSQNNVSMLIFLEGKSNSKDKKKNIVTSFKSHFGAGFNILDENSWHKMNDLNTEGRTVCSESANCTAL